MSEQNSLATRLREVARTLDQISSDHGDTAGDRILNNLFELSAKLDRMAHAISPLNEAAMLTPQQSRILAFIRQHIDQHGHAPTRKEIMHSFSFSSPNGAQEHLRALQRKGVITLTGEARGIRINKQTGGNARQTLTVT